jgi:hypothetical protein
MTIGNTTPARQLHSIIASLQQSFRRWFPSYGNSNVSFDDTNDDDDEWNGLPSTSTLLSSSSVSKEPESLIV